MIIKEISEAEFNLSKAKGIQKILLDSDFKIGDEVIALDPCGVRNVIPINSIGKIQRFIHRRKGTCIFVDFYDDTLKTKKGGRFLRYSGTLKSPLVAKYDFKFHIKQAIKQKGTT